MSALKSISPGLEKVSEMISKKAGVAPAGKKNAIMKPKKHLFGKGK